jgi:hypothetical protein
MIILFVLGFILGAAVGAGAASFYWLRQLKKVGAAMDQVEKVLAMMHQDLGRSTPQ